MFHLWFCLILLDVKINLYQCQCHTCILVCARVEFLPEEITFFRTGGRKWKKLISSISSAEDLEESGINGI